MTTSVAAPRHRWRKPALAVGVAFVITLAAAGTTLLLTRGGEAPPISPVTTTPPPSTTLPATTTTEETPSVEEWSYPAAAVPPFHATIAWDRNPDSEWSIGYQGSTALVDVWSESPRRFRFQLVELDTDLVAQGVPGAGQHMGGPGSYIVGDGEAMGHYWAADGAWGEGPSRHYLAFMFWEPESSEDPSNPFDWASECRDHVTSLTPESVAGRDAYHIVCSTVRGDWELSVDAQTGLILKMLGDTEIDDRLLGTSPEGGFEVTTLEFYDGLIPGSDTLFDVVPPEGAQLPASIDVSAVPPLHAVVTFTGEVVSTVPPDQAVGLKDGALIALVPFSYTQEIWYQDPQNFRVETLEANWGADPAPGDIEAMADGVLTRFYPMSEENYPNGYRVEEGPHGWTPVEFFVSSLDYLPTDTAWSQVGFESVAGRPAEHRVSDTTGIWIDVDTGLLLKLTSQREQASGHTTLTIEIDPTFPEGIFTLAPQPGWCNLDEWSGCTRGTWDGTLLSEGAEVPVFTGPLADGTEFDLADLRGRPAIAFLWWSIYGEDVLEPQLADFEALYQEWGDRVAFVSVAYDSETTIRRFAERVPLTHPMVACLADTTPEGQETNVMCSGETPNYIWGLPFPSWLMIDAEGRAVDLRIHNGITYEDLDAMIAAAVGG